MAYELKRLVDKPEKEKTWKEIDTADGFEKRYFALHKNTFTSMDYYISHNGEFRVL